jgi:tRNA-2-methylthio-N6-dimethylallyladenosine synthase
MKRGYTREQYLEKVEEVRRLVPDIAIATDLIVGFCGETESEFDDTVSLIQTVGYDSIFSFKYSARPNTLADRQLPDDVPEEVKGERLARLQDIQRRMQLRKNNTFVGQTVEVLVDGASKKDPNILSGRTPHNRVVNFNGNTSQMGQLIDVCITQASPNSLAGKV